VRPQERTPARVLFGARALARCRGIRVFV
jgi:hypothetical protein